MKPFLCLNYSTQLVLGWFSVSPPSLWEGIAEILLLEVGFGFVGSSLLCPPALLSFLPLLWLSRQVNPSNVFRIGGERNQNNSDVLNLSWGQAQVIHCFEMLCGTRFCDLPGKKASENPG